jgi:hypothetical protein
MASDSSQGLFEYSNYIFWQSLERKNLGGSDRIRPWTIPYERTCWEVALICSREQIQVCENRGHVITRESRGVYVVLKELA